MIDERGGIGASRDQELDWKSASAASICRPRRAPSAVRASSMGIMIGVICSLATIPIVFKRKGKSHPRAAPPMRAPILANFGRIESISGSD